MLGIFKKKSKKEQLQANYKKYMEQGFKLQSSNRAESDKMYAKAQEVLDEIEQLKE